jgi:hypothetical protein
MMDFIRRDSAYNNLLIVETLRAPGISSGDKKDVIQTLTTSKEKVLEALRDIKEKHIRTSFARNKE